MARQRSRRHRLNRYSNRVDESAETQSQLRTAGENGVPTLPGKRGILAVAERAGVSIATVSRVVNGAASVDPDLSRRVWQAVEAIGYKPNRHAQALVSGRTRLVGLIVAEITNPFFPELIRGFEDAALKRGFGILVGSTNGDPTRTSTWVQRMLQHGVEGLALLTFVREEATVYQLLGTTPHIEVEVGAAAGGDATVGVDYAPGIREAVQHLRSLNHHDIVFAAGPKEDFTAAERERCFRAAMTDAGLKLRAGSVARSFHSLEGGIAIAESLLRRTKLPSALMCSNDLMAIGALRQLTSAGVNVPRDLSLIGLDDIHLAEFTTPTLTTVRLPRADLAQACFDALYRTIKQDETEGHWTRTVSTSLVVRESTSRASQL